jgi:glycosyltransferase involved in cell wall biosynthesis
VRVGLDGTPLLGPRTGVGWYTADLVVAMADAAPDQEFVIFPISWRTARRLELPERENITVARKFAPARPLRAIWDRIGFPPLEAFVRADVFHGTNFLAPPAWRTPTVATVHDIGFVRFPKLAASRERELIDLLPKALHRTAAIITVSDFTRRELIDWQPTLEGKVHVVPNGAHARPLPVAPPVQRPFALVLGSLNQRKNIPLVLDAIAALRDRGVELDLVLAGAAAPDLDVHALIEARRLGDRVTVTGYLDDGAVAHLLVSARVLAFPSLYEGFGMPLIEAMHARLPIVAVKAGATPETVDGAAFLVTDDAEAFADALATVALDDDARAGLIEAGSRRAGEFTWEQAARQTLDVYRAVVA